MKKRILAFVLSLMLAISLLPAASAFSDVTDAALAEKLGLLQTLGIVNGYADGTYRPNNTLKRAEFTKLTVGLCGELEAAASYANFTIFGDVPSSYWAAGVINYAARELKLVKGYTDSVGSFKPESNIAYDEAVTIVMRALGYTDADTGYRWPEGYMERAAAIGLLDGISLGNKDALNRANGATLFYNALYAAKKDGKKLIDTLIGTPINNALVMSLTAVAADGTPNSVKIDGQASIVKTSVALPDSLIGKRVDFTISKEDTIIGYKLLDQTSVTVAVNYCDSEKITALDGSTYKIPETVRIFPADKGLEGTASTYSKVRSTLSVGDGVQLVYRADGELDYVLLLGSGSERGSRIIGINATASTLLSTLGAPADTPVYKNGALVAVADLATNDVATYNPDTGIISVCNFKLHGKYELAFPNAAAPTAITTLGNRFELSASAAASLADFKIGDYFTLLFTSDGKVARVIKTSGASPMGLYTGTTVEFINGPTLTMTFTNVSAGELVTVSATGTASRLTGSTTTKTLDLEKGMLGDTELAPGCAFFERVGSSGALSAIDREDITVSTIPASKIAFVVTDAAGRPIIIVLDDVTGDRYVYGELTGSTEVPGKDAFDVTKYFVTVNNAAGSKRYQMLTSSLPANGWGGVALDREGKITSTCELTKYTGIARTDFIGSESVMIDGVEVQIPESVQIYIAATGQYITEQKDIREKIADARAFGSTFEAYLDKAPEEGGKVRILIVK